MQTLRLMVVLSLALPFALFAQDQVERADWGALSRQSGEGKIVVAIESLPADGRLPLKTPFDSIIGGYIEEPGRIGPGAGSEAHAEAKAGAQMPGRIGFQFNEDATRLALVPAKGTIKPGSGAIVVLEVADKSQQFPDGRWVFSALDAKLMPAAGAQAATAKLESHPGNHRIGFWTNVNESVQWEFTATRPGMYDMELTYSLAGGISDISIALDDVTVDGVIAATGSWYAYTTVTLGKVYVKNAGKHTVRVAATKKTGAAVMNLKAVTLRPTGEGKPVVQNDDGTIIMHARDVTIQGTKVQYEPQPNKLTVGYWVNESDRAYWIFTVTKPGTFEVEILQGCGKGQGGSDAALKLLEKTGFGKDQMLPFVVEDTGHFQNFVPRKIGRLSITKPGQYTLIAMPVKKAKAAVMDLRQVTLTPVKE